MTTALANAQLGNVNQIGPDGSVTYSTNGGQTFTDPTSGASYFIPQYTQTTQLSAQQQAIKDQNDAAALNLSTIGNDQSKFLGEYLSKPVDLSNEATEARLMDLGRARLDPLVAQRDADLRTRLANQGIKAGSAAYDRELNTFNQGTNDAYNQLLLTGRGQAVQEALTERNQPINEIIGLMSGTQVGTPEFGAATNPQSMPTVDYSALVNENYNQQMGQYQQQMASRNSMIGGLFGLGGKLIGLSEDDTKEDKKRLGDIEGEMGLWEFRYKDDPKGTPKQLGLMASEVEKEKPQAVKRGKDGKRRVDYGTALGLMGYK